MKRVSRMARPHARMPFPAMKPSCAMVLLAYSAMPMAATQNDRSDDVIRPRMSDKGISVAQVTFDPSLTMGTPGGALDVTRFENGNPVIAGEYRPDIYLSGRLIGREIVVVRASGNNASICFNRALLDRLNVDFSLIDRDVLAELVDPSACVDLKRAIPAASVSFNSSEMRLDVSVPQASLRHTARGYVDPQLWDSGVTAATLGYSANLYRNVSHGVGADSAYVGLNSGLNVGGWMFRHNGALTWRQNASSRYSNTNTYVQHDVTALKARVTIGDANTSGEVFDTFAFRGVQLATDDRMWPDSLRGYAPVVRGIADSNARVTIRQGSSVIYDASVPPGQFVIDDLYPTGYGGDLEVTVTEADGRVKSFKVPYASVAQLLRPGMTRYSVLAGNVRNVNLSYTPRVMEATFQRGVTNTLTLYGGVLAASNYASVLAGGAFSTPLGAIALDVSGARTSAAGQSLRGASIRATYSKLFAPTNSNISVAAYRFSSPGYLNLNNALIFADNARRGVSGADATQLWRARNRLSITASQALGDKWGQFFFSGYTQNYWDRGGADTQFQVGYSNHFRNIDYSVTANRSRVSSGQMDTQYMLTVSLPLGRTSRAPRLSLNVAHDTAGGMTGQAVMSGVAGADNQASYTVAASRDDGSTYAGNVSGQYRSPYTTVQGAYGGGAHYYSGSLGLSGSIVAHPGGVTASPYAAETMAIVAAPAAAGAKVASYPGVRLDPRGYGVVPYLSPYRLNEITLDPKDIPNDVELRTTSQGVAPRLGAVVMLRYPTVTGRPVLIRSRLPDGGSLPFGAPVSDSKGNSVGTVTQGGQIYARISGPRERLTVKWGHADAWECSIDVTLPEQKKAGKGVSFDRLQAPCELTRSPVSYGPSVSIKQRVGYMKQSDHAW